MSEIKAIAADMAMNIAEKLIQVKLTATDKSELIKDGIKQMGSTLD